VTAPGRQVAASFALAVLSAICAPQIVHSVTKSNDVMTWMDELGTFMIGPAWVILALNIVLSGGKRALWILVGLPFALYCDGIFLLVFVGCVTGHPCP
jgi:hypothetical protein